MGEPEDLEQEVALRLFRHAHRFNPNKASWEAFTTVVCRTQLLNLLEKRCAQRRSPRLEAASLNATVVDGKGQTDDRATLISSACHARRLEQQTRPEQEHADLQNDLRTVMGLLPAMQQQICARLQHDGPAAVARQLGISRRTLYDHIRQIRGRFEQAGLREYL